MELGGNLVNLGGTGWIFEELGRSWRNWEELGGNRVGTGRKPGESWRNWVDLGGNRVNLGRSGWNWEELSCQKMLFIFIITIRLIHVLEFSVVALFSFLCMI